MGITGATLNDKRATTARVQIPAWGCWYADVELDGEHTLSGPVTLKIADLTLVGTVLSGGPVKGRSQYRLVAGGGGWGRTLPKKPYVNDAGVKLATVLGDAAREAGETLGTISNATRLGPYWTRQAGQASNVLALVSERAWYVDNAGVTQLGVRPSANLPSNVTRIQPLDLARATVTLSSESIASILPGVTVDTITAVDVEHSISAQGGLRSKIWGARGGGSSRALDGLASLLDVLDPDRAFRGVTEYRVVTRTGKRLNLQPVRVSTGMPDLARVRVRPGVAGLESEVPLGSTVLVTFVNSDPSRPVVTSFGDPEEETFGNSAFIARLGDAITISPAQFAASGAANGSGPVTLSNNLEGTISSASTKAKAV